MIHRALTGSPRDQGKNGQSDHAKNRNSDPEQLLRQTHVKKCKANHEDPRFFL